MKLIQSLKPESKLSFAMAKVYFKFEHLKLDNRWHSSVELRFKFVLKIGQNWKIVLKFKPRI